MTEAAVTQVTLADELADLVERIAIEQGYLGALRADLDAALARHVMGEPDVEGLATVRAAVAHQVDSVDLLVHAREILLHKQEMKVPD